MRHQSPALHLNSMPKRFKCLFARIRGSLFIIYRIKIAKRKMCWINQWHHHVAVPCNRLMAWMRHILWWEKMMYVSDNYVVNMMNLKMVKLHYNWWVSSFYRPFIAIQPMDGDLVMHLKVKNPSYNGFDHTCWPFRNPPKIPCHCKSKI